MNENFFTYRNLSGDYSAVENDIRLGTPTAAFGVSDELKYLLASLSRRQTLYVAADAVSAAKAHKSISVLSGKKCVRLPAKDEVILYKDALSKDALFNRLTAVHALQSGADIIVADVQALMQLVPARVESITFEAGGDYDYVALPSKLVGMGYSREYVPDSRGTFTVRGDILDIFPVNSDTPVRIDFFGDAVERIRPYDAASGERLEAVESVTVISAVEAPYETEEIVNIKKEISENLKTCADSAAYRRAKTLSEELIAKLESGAPFAGSAFVMPLLKCARTVFDCLKSDALIIFDECKLVNDALNGLYNEHTERVKELKKGGEAFAFSINQMLSSQTLIDAFNKFVCFAVQTFTSSTQFFSPLKTYSFRSTPAPSYLNAVPQLVTDIKNWLSGGYRVLIFTGSVVRSQKLSEILNDEYLPLYPVPDVLEALRGVCVTSEDLPHGFILHENKLVVIGSGDIYTKAPAKRLRKKRADMFSAPEIGDYAVHEKHGIGKITGTKKIETTDGIKEYVAIEYKGGDVLYVPVEQMDVLSKYVGEGNPSLSKIGGAEFDRVKERVKRSIRALAFDLKQLYAERSEKRGYRFPENSEMMREFEEAFEYEETPDQLASAEEIKADMCSDKVMDRLLCGDVGYGKTEVALRAVYLCVLGGKQAALMCPGTVLSEQHFNTAIERFKDFGVRVEKLNRFKTPRQQAETLKRLAEGDIDFIIGTHRLLSSDVKFYDLGLLVLDEEQRFGVAHKEKFKEAFTEVDVLMLSATPIPRTLNMAMSGIRDMSVIEEPPQDRYPVQTYVIEYNTGSVIQAIVRELRRGGQVYYIHNRVETIMGCAARLHEYLPDARIVCAHGKMNEEEMSDIWEQLVEHEIDILVCTTIIETGVDVPNVNTLIIEDSDRFGLSQLYQLRGRVGRSNRRGYAYFTYQRDKVLTEIASKRLSAMKEFTQFGSGFRIALRDLEIRGAGSILSGKQHGHMEAVGYDMYLRLLSEAISEEKGEQPEKVPECLVDIQIEAHIPEKYISSLNQRLDVYRKIMTVTEDADKIDLLDELIDRYGEPPKSVVGLIDVSLLRNKAAHLGITEISQKNGSMYFYTEYVSTEQIAALSAAYKGRITFNGMGKSYVSVKITPKVRPFDMMRETVEIFYNARSGNS